MHWKIYALLSTLAWSAWGIAVKFALKRLSWMQLEVLSGIAALVIILLIAPSGYRLKPDGASMVGLIAATCGVGGAVFFYLAMSQGPVSIVIPLTSLYVVGVAVIGVVFLGEDLTIRKTLAVLCAVAAVILLSMEKG